ncbi:MAG: hypothetical protein IJU23_13055 [Proteobacteria bacterium]|nr:hypothetical protein [Pseudomonadota bacterium]
MGGYIIVEMADIIEAVTRQLAPDNGRSESEYMGMESRQSHRRNRIDG